MYLPTCTSNLIFNKTHTSYSRLLIACADMLIGRIAFFLWTVSSSALAEDISNRLGKPIVIDTDIFSDVDDVGSLAVANVLHNYGLADLRGVAVNTHSEYGALAVSVINTYFGNGDVPIAAIRPFTDETFFDKRDFV